MKTFTHVVLPIAIVVVLVGVVAYVTQNTSPVPELPKHEDSGKTPASGPISGDVLAWDQDLSADDPKPVYVEFKSHNHKDFTQTVLMCIQRKSCTCTNLEIGSFDLPDAELQAILKNPTLTGLAKLAVSAKFEPLIEVVKLERNQIPGTPAGGTPRPYLLRVNWEAKKTPGEVMVDKITTQVRAEIEGGASNVYPKDVSFVVVPTIGFYPFVLEIGDITRGSSGSAEFYVWSETRDRLSIKGRITIPVEGSPTEPCAALSEPVELSPDELKALPQMLGERFANMKPRCAYKLRATLFEHMGDKQLDMGPVNRRVNLDFPPERFQEKIEEAHVPINAIVKGEVRLINGDKKDRIDLGTYKFSRGQKAVAVLVAENPNVDLEVAATSSAKLHATLSNPQLVEGQRQWQLAVEMEPNSLIGPMPEGTMITLRTKGPNPRTLRIPVAGRADR
jgi:hypothetical protein